MFDVVFNDSERGSMKVAKKFQKEDMLQGAVGYIGMPPTRRALDERYEGVALGGNPGEVIGLPFCLDIGDIAKGADSGERRDFIFEIQKNPFHNDAEDDAAFLEYWQDCLLSLQRLKDGATSGEKFRVWYGDAPYSACGLYYVASMLAGFDAVMTAVKLPAYRLGQNDTVIEYASWGEVMPGKFHDFLPLETEIPKLQQNVMAQRWLDLQKENAPLRAVVNGKLMSVGEDFYDRFICACIPDGEFLMARLIGDTLGRYPLGIGDWWIAQRIRRMIARGELTVTEDNEVEYRKKLIRAGAAQRRPM